MHSIHNNNWSIFLSGAADQALLNTDEQIIKYPFDQFWISIHDHWLNEKEAAHSPMMFSHFEKMGEMNKYLLFERNFLDLFVYLFESTPMLIYGSNDEESLNYGFYQLDDKEEVLNLTRNALRGEVSSDFILPDYKVVMVCGHDLTWPVYGFEKIHFNTVKSLATKHSLPVLE